MKASRCPHPGEGYASLLTQTRDTIPYRRSVRYSIYAHTFTERLNLKLSHMTNSVFTQPEFKTIYQVTYCCGFNIEQFIRLSRLYFTQLSVLGGLVGRAPDYNCAVKVEIPFKTAPCFFTVLLLMYAICFALFLSLSCVYIHVYKCIQCCIIIIEPDSQRQMSSHE